MTSMPTQPLNTGSAMPLVGLGLWKIGRDVVADVVVEAVRAGYRHLDSACDCGNEKEVGVQHHLPDLRLMSAPQSSAGRSALP